MNNIGYPLIMKLVLYYMSNSITIIKKIHSFVCENID